MQGRLDAIDAKFSDDRDAMQSEIDGLHQALLASRRDQAELLDKFNKFTMETAAKFEAVSTSAPPAAEQPSPAVPAPSSGGPRPWTDAIDQTILKFNTQDRTSIDTSDLETLCLSL